MYLSACGLEDFSFDSWSDVSTLLSRRECLLLESRNYQTDLRNTQYIFGRLLLKQILSSCLNVNIHAIDILAFENGAPRLIINNSFVDYISLSISHYSNTIFVAAGLNCTCGVDVQSVSGVDWPSVLRAMNWSVSIDGQWLGVSSDVSDEVYVCQQVRSALIWSGYEAWFKANRGLVMPSDFLLHKIKLIQSDSVTGSRIFQMFLGRDSSYYDGCIYIKLLSDEVFAVAAKSTL